MAILPTGGGKSICYQVPALAQDGVCLVISPLIALMKDQIEQLRSKGILALGLYSGMSRRQMVQTLKNAGSDQYKLLYVSPERLETSLFLEYLPSLHINLIAVDEAHCISQWGYDFRPSYLRIAALRQELPDVPVLALTASATPIVQKDIAEKLALPNVQVFQQSFSRPNLSYSVFEADSKLSKLVDVVRNVPGSGLVYCKSRKRTTQIAALLQMHGFSADYYHAGLPTAVRSQRQEDWMADKIKVMVCTTAFGMGIDKPDVRFVVHADVPDSLESYYQEAGRAGRDGKKSYAVLLHATQDIHDLALLHEKRFPTFQQIKEVYQALGNYLQLPVSHGEDQSYDFRFEEFVQRFKVDSTIALYAIKALESDGWLYFNEKNFSPSTLGFTATKKGLHDFQETYPQHEALLTTLLRTYEGIFDFPVFISEKVLAQLLRKEETDIVEELKKLNAMGILQYGPQTDAPQILLRKNRVAAADLVMNLSLYHQRKAAFIQRVEKMIAYTKSTDCRAVFINHYFGDNSSTPCGICDTCLQHKGAVLSPEEFNSISKKIGEIIETKAVNMVQLKEALNGINKQKAWKVIQFLQAENKISITKDGILQSQKR